MLIVSELGLLYCITEIHRDKNYKSSKTNEKIFGLKFLKTRNIKKILKKCKLKFSLELQNENANKIGYGWTRTFNEVHISFY